MPNIDFNVDTTLAQRFRKYVAFGTESECWQWTGCTSSQGYGNIGVRQGGPNSYFQHVAAHRVAWELYCGPIPEGMHVLHHCDNPGCVNPKHLFLGTHQDNMADKVAKGRHKSQAAIDAWRQAKGRKLTPAQYEQAAAKPRGQKHWRARPIRVHGVEYPTQTAAAQALGVTRQAVHYMLKRGDAEVVEPESAP